MIKNERENIMILVERLQDELPELPTKGEEFPVHPWEATLGYVLVEEIHIRRRSDGAEISQIWGFG